MIHERAAGILLAVSSLPSPFGIGSFGNAAREWLRFLNAAGQKYWQILPLGPTGWGDSPYQSFSAFAISPYYVDLQSLTEQGSQGESLLLEEEASAVRWGKKPDAVDYAALYRNREPLLRRACERFQKNAAAESAAAFDSFRNSNSFWLDDYSLFMAIKKKHRGRSWLEWGKQLKLRNRAALEKIKIQFAPDIYFHSFVQYLAYTQWQAIREYAHGLGIAIIGDMPIYAAADSADAWANSELFQLDEERRPLRVAGCPPDPFAAGGQLWGNPLYRWDVIAETGFSWWIARLRSGFALYDIIRIDHFRGFESYFSIDASALVNKGDASGGVWVQGPGLSFIEAVNRELPGAAIIAEDLGFLTEEVRALLRASGYPGMKVLQFAFDSREASDYMPYTYGRNCVVYTGTHDSPTSLGWFKSAYPGDVKLALDFLGIKNGKEGNWAFIRSALASVANTAIIPMQDYLGLDDRARMNIPSTLGGNNWRWRMLPEAASPALAEKISHLTAIYGR
ncbi:MAG: 4-alpha-glucanotransferase [Treponema sp.]|jgi:4-alpha-glucanotransferase|nr:4-alpha-glucanotransferase [Treponema sp.]